MDVDELEDNLGNCSCYKIFIIISCIVCIFVAAIPPQTAVYYNGVPNHRCDLSYLDEVSTGNVSEDYIASLIIPPGDSCKQYEINSTECLITRSLSCIANASENGIVECERGYYYDDTYFEKTIVSEWDLVCNRSIINTIVESLVFVGAFFGSPPAGYLIDWYGRRLALLILSLGLLGSGIGCAVSPTLALYCIFRFIEGATSISLCGAIFSYANEIASRKFRSNVGMLIMLSAAVSHTIFPLMAYFLRDWRDLNLTCGLLMMAFIVTWPFIPETPRWLLMKGYEAEAKKVLERYARSKGRTMNDEDWRQVVEVEKKKMKSINTRSHLIDLFRRPFTRIVTLIVMFDWFAVNCVFYGLILNVGSLLGDPYLNGTLNGATEIVAVFVFGILKKKSGAKWCLVVGMSCAGSFCLIALITQEIDGTNEIVLQIVRWTSITGKLFASVAFNSVYQYTTDVYPTITRWKAMALASTCARIGSILIPFVIHAQSGSLWITQAIFGILGLSAGLATVIVPNTSTKSFTTTLQEAEKGYCNEMKWAAKFIGNQKEEDENKRGILLNNNVDINLEFTKDSN